MVDRALYESPYSLPEALFYSPPFGVSPERVLENHRRIIQIFGRTPAPES